MDAEYKDDTIEFILTAIEKLTWGIITGEYDQDELWEIYQEATILKK